MLTPIQRRFVESARRAILATQSPSGRPRPLAICFALAPDDGTGITVVYSPIDEKPKRSTDPLGLARVRDVRARPEVSILVDRWDEDWSKLGWVRLEALATLLVPPTSVEARPELRSGAVASDPEGERAMALRLLRERYQQYRTQDLESRPLLRLAVTGVSSWGAIDEW